MVCVFMLHDGIYSAQQLDVPAGVSDAGMDRIQEEFMHTPGLVTLMLT